MGPDHGSSLTRLEKNMFFTIFHSISKMNLDGSLLPISAIYFRMILSIFRQLIDSIRNTLYKVLFSHCDNQSVDVCFNRLRSLIARGCLNVVKYLVIGVKKGSCYFYTGSFCVVCMFSQIRVRFDEILDFFWLFP